MNRNKSNSFVSNVMIVLSAQIIVKILGIFYKMVITNINGFGDEGNGYYSAGFQVYTLLLSLSSVGIPNAISKLISEKMTVSDYIGAKKLFKTAVLIFSFIGVILSGGLYFLSAPIAKYILNMEGAKYTLAALSPSVFFVCVSSVIRGYFSGINKMQIMGLSQIIEQFFKSVLTILFVIISVGSSAEYMSAYANFATTAATVFGTLYLCYAYKFKNNRQITDIDSNIKSDFVYISKQILAIAVPISVCSVISAINRIVDTATITRGIENAFRDCIPAHIGSAAITNPSPTQLNAEAVRLSGMLSKSDTLINLPLALNVALATVLVPSVSKYNAEKNMIMIRKYVNSSLLTSVVLILPCITGYIILAGPIYSLLYPNAPLGFELLQISAVSLAFTALNQTLTGVLQGMGVVHVPALALAAGCVVKLILNIALISIRSINIYGAAIGSVFCQITIFIIELYYLSKGITGKIYIRKMFAKPFACCVIMGAGAYIIYNTIYRISGSNFASVVASVFLSAVVYGMEIILLKVFSYDELSKMPILKKLCKFLPKDIYETKNI